MKSCAIIRVVLPFHLRTLARVEGEVQIAVPEPVTIRAVLDAIEENHPVLCGTIRDQVTRKRRPFIRFFACKEDFSNEPTGTLCPPRSSAAVNRS
jgi:sulfur-carrier protein